MQLIETIKQKPYPHILLLLVYIASLYIYGVMPGQWCSFPGSVDFGIPSIKLNQIFYNEKLGYPLGNFYPEGLPYISFRLFLSYIFNISEYASGQIELGIIILLSIIGMKRLLVHFNVNEYVAIFFSFIFVITPINMGHVVGYPPLAKTLLILPILIYTDLYVYKKINYASKLTKKHILLLPIIILAKNTAMFGNGYGFIFYNFISFGFLTFYLIKNKTPKIIRSISLILIFLISNGIAILLYRLYIPGGASYNKESIDFFRAQGVDLYTMIAPGKNLVFFKMLGLGKHWDSYTYYGDGSNVYFNYIGFSFIILLIIAFIKKGFDSALKKTLIAIFLCATIFSFGPSIKINDTRDLSNGGGLSYHMKKSEATLSIGTEFIYNLPGIKNMRSVYRWMYVSKFVLLIIAAISISLLLKNQKNRILACCLILLVLIEFFPDVKKKNEQRKNFYKMGLKFSEDVTDKLSPYMKENEKIYIYSHANDFLAKIIGNRYSSFLYNINGDKKIGLVRKQWPYTIKKIYKTKSNINDYVYKALKSEDLDVFILPIFSLRWDFYSWPPNKQKIENYKREINELFDFSDRRFKIQEEKYFIVITLNNNYDSEIVLDKDVSMISRLNEAQLIGQGDMQSPWGKRISKVEIESLQKTGIFSAPRSQIIYHLNVAEDNMYLKFSIGYMPVAKNWNVSDGTRALVVVKVKNKQDTLCNEYILPNDNFRDIQLPLDKYHDNKITLSFISEQDANKNFNGDWLVWVNPIIAKLE